MTINEFPENFWKLRTAERDGNGESLLSNVCMSEDWAKPHERESNAFECMYSSKRENKIQEQNQTVSKVTKLLASDFDQKQTLLTRVWSWLRMNAGGVLNTCKSNEALIFDSSDEEASDWVADGWVTRG